MTEPEFFSPDWAAAVRDALAAGPSSQDRAGKLPMYWDFFEKVKAGYASSWALGCRDLPAGRLPCSSSGAAARSPTAASPGQGTTRGQGATYVLGMDYAGWQALHDGYDPQRTVMYRKILVEEGNILEFFKGIYFFTECLAVIGKVPAGFRALAVG